MTISTTTSRVSYNGNGVTTVFSFPYRFLANGDLTVILVSAAGAETVQVLSTNYTVTGADADAGGSVTMIVPPASGERLVILREVSLTQETDYISGDAFPAESHERALDKLTMITQGLQEQVDRSLKVTPGSDGDPSAIIADIGVAVGLAEGFAEDAADSADASAASASAANVSAIAADASADAAAASVASIGFPLSVANGGTGQTTAAGIQSILPVQQVRVDVASASTVNLTTGAVNTDHINITGTTTITGFTVAAGRMLFARFSGSLVLTSGAAITTQQGANIVTQNGDTCIIRALSANVVEILSYREGRLITPAGAAPMYACRAWVNFSGTGTVTIRASGNVSSITDNGVGDYTINFATAMPDTSYAIVTGGRTTAPGYSSVQTDQATAITAGAFRLSTVQQNAGVPTATDCDAVSVAVFR